ncbi:MAG: MerR family transcriptional regulator, partial [Pseudomonadota bacterium]
MNIGEASTESGVSSKMIRHYEAAGLFPAAQRTGAGYRQYDQNEVQTLRFIRHARDLGFSIPEISKLVSLWQNRRRPSRLVKELALA